MANFVHAKRRADGFMFRVWNTVVDAYETPPMTRAEVFEYLNNERAAERLDRAESQGTSSKLGETRDLDGPWDTERCDSCGGFHHAFLARGGFACARCGEPEGDHVHRCRAQPGVEPGDPEGGR